MSAGKLFRGHRLMAGIATSLYILVFLLPAEAHAYIDPGSGALLLQAIAAGVAGVAFFMRDTLRRGARWLGARFGMKSLQEPKEDAPSDDQ